MCFKEHQCSLPTVLRIPVETTSSVVKCLYYYARTIWGVQQPIKRTVLKFSSISSFHNSFERIMSTLSHNIRPLSYSPLRYTFALCVVGMLSYYALFVRQTWIFLVEYHEEFVKMPELLFNFYKLYEVLHKAIMYLEIWNFRKPYTGELRPFCISRIIRLTSYSFT